MTDTNEIRGPNVCLMGPAGTGKTHSIGTLVDSGIEVFYLDMETGLESVLGYWRDRNLPIPPNLHWARMPVTNASFAEMISTAKKINTQTYESITKLQDPDRSKHDKFVQLLTILNDFPDERTGKSYGSVQEWDSTRAIVIDGLTGIGAAAMTLVIGGKPVRNQSEWGMAQDQTERLLRMLCDNCPCMFVLLAHVEREVDAILGGVKIMVSSLGKALPPKIAPMFSDVILTVREGSSWTWDTSNSQADLKTRNLPIKAGQTPTFATIITKWRNRVTPETATPAPIIDTIIS